MTEATQGEIDAIQERYEQEVHALQFQRFDTPEEFFTAVKVVGDKYAEQHPAWAAWADRIRETAIGYNMGKLHTLKRAIERDPERWIWWLGKFTFSKLQIESAQDKRAYGARFYDGMWRPYYTFRKGSPYRGFVRHVLNQLGYKDVN